MPIHRPFRNDNYITFVQYIQYVFPVSAIICMNRPPDTLFAVCTQFDRAAAPWNKKVRFFASSIWFCRPSQCIRIVFKIKSRPTYVFGTAFQYRFNRQSLISAAFGFRIKRSLSGLVCGVLVILTTAACFFFFSPLFLPRFFFFFSSRPP